jgi:hypothetical protein
LLPLASCSVSPSLTSIAITPNATVTVELAPPGVPQGYSQYTAIGSYTRSGHTAETEDITNQVTWSSSAPQVATINSSGVATATGFNPTTGIAWIGNTTISASMPGFGGEDIVSNDVTFTVTACTICTSTSTEPITGLSITPSTDSVALPGQTGQFIALGISGTTGLPTNMTTLVAWSSSNAGVATICTAGSPLPCTPATDGLAMAVGPGTTQITALYTNPDKSVVSATATFTVTGSASEPLQSIAITPATQSMLAGQTSQLIAIGTFSPTAATPGTQNLTTSVKWASSNTSIASICTAGSPLPCTPATDGLVTAVGPGAAVITAIATNPADNSVVTATATVTVTGGSSSSEPLVSLAVLPLTQTSLTTGASANVNFIAIGTTGSGGTVLLTNAVQTVNGQTIDPATWTSSNPAVASIVKATGVATPLSAGTTAITAIATNPDGTVVTGSAAYTVTVPTITEPYVSLAIVPASQTLTAVGQQANYIAIGTTGSGASVNLTGAATWGSSNISVAKPTATLGQFSALANGVTAVTATVPNPGVGGNPPDGTVVTASATLTVATTAAPEPLLSTTIYPSSPSVASPGLTSQLADIGTFSAAPITQDVTKGITNLDGIANQNITTSWSSSTPAVATVTTVCPTGITALSCTISACPGTSNAGVCTSCPGAMVASGASCATLNPTTPVGLVTGLSQGTTAIMAVASNPDGSQVIASVAFSVTGGSTEQITALTIIPAAISATSPAQKNQLLALGTEGTLQYDVTSQVVWKSNTSTVASICTAGDPLPCTAATDGLVTAATAGSTIITATWTNLDKSEVVAQATYTVAIGASPEPLISINVVPQSVTVSNKGMTQQYLAFGNFTTIPTLRDITDSVTWITLDPNLASINSEGTPGEPAGLATAMGYWGLAVIYAEGTNPDNTIVLSNAVTFTCQEPGVSPPVCNPDVAPSLLATLTVFNAGSNDTNWLITAPSDTGVPNLIHCGPGSEIAGLGNSVCTGTYAAGTNVTITASLAGAALDNTFGGWTANCDNSIPPIYTPNMTNTCTLPNLSNPSGLVGDQSVGALFYGLTLSCSKVTSDPVGTAFPINAITVTNGKTPYTFSVVGTLPTGLALNTSTGAVTGTPTVSGSFSITATDANGTTAASTCGITIN